MGICTNCGCCLHVSTTKILPHGGGLNTASTGSIPADSTADTLRVVECFLGPIIPQYSEYSECSAWYEPCLKHLSATHQLMHRIAWHAVRNSSNMLNHLQHDALVGASRYQPDSCREHLCAKYHSFMHRIIGHVVRNISNMPKQLRHVVLGGTSPYRQTYSSQQS